MSQSIDADQPAAAVPSQGPQHESPREIMRIAIAEFVASALFIFASCGAAIATTRFNLPGNVTIEIALAFGLSLVALCWTIGHVSGGHLNCVVSFSFALVGKITWTRAFAYFFAQWLGGMVGAGFLRAIAPSAWNGDCLAANRINSAITVGQGLVTEIILTFFLMLVINSAADQSKAKEIQILVPVSIGFCVTACHMLAIPLTGTSLNPTRSFASAAVSRSIPECSDVWNNHWVFWLGPMLGGVAASLIYEFVFLERGASGSLENQYKDQAVVETKKRDFVAELFGRKKAAGATFDDVQAIQ
jgi:MIP family channel proteins